MSERPLVTIVTPSYNQGRFIRATIQSVLDQDYPAIEYIVMDGGSSDATAAIAAEFGDRLRFFSERDDGQSDAINKGFRMAQGEIVAWLNSDDLLLPGAVSKAVAGLQAHPKAAAVYGEGYQIDAEGQRKQRFPFTTPFNLWKLTYLHDYILQQTVFFRKSCVAEAGWLREDLHYGMDWELLVRLGKRYGLAYIREDLGCLREYSEAKSFSGGVRRFHELASILREHTGEKRPPGWWFYGMDTYDKLGRELIERWIPGSVGRTVGRLFVRACRMRVDYVQYFSQGLYEDGWAGPRLHWMLPQGARRILIRGFLAASLHGQRIRVWVDGKLQTERFLPAGEFEMTVAAQPDHPAVLRVDTDRVVRGPNGRRVGWRMLAIEGRQ